jgi:hypothetical protein
VARDHDCFVREGEETIVNGGQEFACVASGKVSAADGAGEEGVSSEQEGLGGKVEADGAFGVARSMEDGAGERSEGDAFAVVEGVVGVFDGGGGDTEPGGLLVHDFDLGEVVLVTEDGGSGELFEAMGASDVINVGVGDKDLLNGEFVSGEEGEDAGNVVTGIDDDGLAGGLVAEDGAVALERTYWDCFKDHGLHRLSMT